jgi:hypothetical protein
MRHGGIPLMLMLTGQPAVFCRNVFSTLAFAVGQYVCSASNDVSPAAVPSQSPVTLSNTANERGQIKFDQKKIALYDFQIVRMKEEQKEKQISA